MKLKFFDSGNGPKLLRRQVMLLELPQNGKTDDNHYYWSKKGGYQGNAIISRIYDNAERLGWKK